MRPCVRSLAAALLPLAAAAVDAAAAGYKRDPLFNVVAVSIQIQSGLFLVCRKRGRNARGRARSVHRALRDRQPGAISPTPSRFLHSRCTAEEGI